MRENRFPKSLDIPIISAKYGLLTSNEPIEDYLVFEDPAAGVERWHGWFVPPAWEFVSEVWAYERKPVREVAYDHEDDDAIQMIREMDP